MYISLLTSCGGKAAGELSVRDRGATGMDCRPGMVG